MIFVASPWVRQFSSTAALLLLLSGCAFGPGMNLGSHLDGTFRPNAKLGGTVASDSLWPSWLRPERASVETTPTLSDTPPPGVLLDITPELIRAQRAAQPSAIAQDVRRLFGTPKPYRIGPGDVLGIVLWSHPEIVFPPSSVLTTVDATGQSAVGNGFSVSADGIVQFPYVGAVKVAGLTEFEARQLLTREAAKYLKNPQLTVRVQGFRSARVYVDGEVRTPGLFAITDLPLTLPDAIGRAGGFTANADRSAVAITRDDSTTLISMAQLTELGINPSNIVLAAGDLVRVLNREDAKVFVMGEVLRPAALLMRNGRLSLSEALGESGGVNQTSADPRQIFVLRNGAAGRPQVFHLDARSPLALAMADGFELKPRDVVFVDPAPLVRFSRVVGLLVPSTQLLTTPNLLVK